jgi:hypothetical protein
MIVVFFKITDIAPGRGTGTGGSGISFYPRDVPPGGIVIRGGGRGRDELSRG